MIPYKKVNIISIDSLQDFLMTKGCDPKLVWDTFADGEGNDSYNYWDLDALHDAITVADYCEQPEKITIYNCVIEAIHNEEMPKDFLLNVFW